MIYALACFLSAFLLFQVQLILAKHILPWYGGGAAVWTTSLFFFQLMLAAGYSYSHLLAERFPTFSQIRLHSLLLIVSVAVSISLLGLWGSPLLAASSWKPVTNERPILSILLLLTVSVGLPFLLLAATSPLLQSWFAKTRPETPYRLYSYSNLGSLLGLLSYPFLVEPTLSLRPQALLWWLLYLVWVGLIAGSGWQTAGRSSHLVMVGSKVARAPGPRLKQSAGWTLWALAGSMLLLAVTNQMAQEVASHPMLWVVPLSLYLISFTICFHHSLWYRRRVMLPLLVLATLWSVQTLTDGLNATAWQQWASYAFVLLAGSLVCHGELYRRRPSTDSLTLFYWWIAVGGAAGGIFVGVVAPHLFSGYWEFHLALVLVWLLFSVQLIRDRKSPLYRGFPGLSGVAVVGLIGLLSLILLHSVESVIGRSLKDSWLYVGVSGVNQWLSDTMGWSLPRLGIPLNWGFLYYGLTLVAFLFNRRIRQSSAIWAKLCLAMFLCCLALRLHQHYASFFEESLHVSRNFFGVVRVYMQTARSLPGLGASVVLQHGQTIHGVQFTQAPHLPTTYFGKNSGAGIALEYTRLTAMDRARRIGVLGLGVGTLASYARPGDSLRFYEINPDVVGLASGEQAAFSYIAQSPADISVLEGDGRLLLERQLREEGSQQFDMLFVDAFSSDSVPLHLLTLEAAKLYVAHLRSDGILAFNVTNRFLDLKPVVSALARELALENLWIESFPEDETQLHAEWILLTADREVFRQPPFSLLGKPLDMTSPTSLWTDSQSNLFQVLR